MEIRLSNKYEPLFALLDPSYHPEVSKVIITGGRNSQKSFATALFACVSARDYGWNTLYTRFTLVSAKDSIIADFNEKIDLLQSHTLFNVTSDRVESLHNKSKIVFKGIKTSQGNQTASLKSLKDFNLWIYDEAEEHPDFDSWDKVQKSIRSNVKRNLSIMLLNPTGKSHWIYETFFEERGVQAGFNGVVGDTMYIHTTYLDLDRDIIADNIWHDFEACRIAFEQWSELPKDERELRTPLRKKALYYKHAILGGWLEKSEGIIFDNWSVGTFIDTGYTMYGCDFGFNDPTSIIKVSVDERNKKLYLKEEYYKSGITETDIYNIISSKCMDYMIVADSANPMIIESFKRKGLNIEPAVKGPDSIKAGILLMQDYDMIVDESSTNLIKELNNYCWNDKKSGVPIDAYNHAIDSARYALTRLKQPVKEIWVGW